MDTKIQSFDPNIFYPKSYPESYSSELEGYLEIEGLNQWTKYDIPTFPLNYINQEHQLRELVSLTNMKEHSSHDQRPSDHQNLERLSWIYDSFVASQIDQQSRFATSNTLLQDFPSGADQLTEGDIKKAPTIWPLKETNFTFQHEQPNQDVTQTEQYLSNHTLGKPQSVVPKQSSVTDLSALISEEDYIPDDIEDDDANWRLDPTLKQQTPRFPGDLYTPHYVKIKDGKRWGLCRYCFEVNKILWLRIKCSSYW